MIAAQSRNVGRSIVCDFLPWPGEPRASEGLQARPVQADLGGALGMGAASPAMQSTGCVRPALNPRVFHATIPSMDRDTAIVIARMTHGVHSVEDNLRVNAQRAGKQ